MDISKPTFRSARSVNFRFYTQDEIKKISVKQITNPIMFDNLGHVIPNGLYDASLGPVDKFGVCQTCNLNAAMCPGHFGHIELPVPCYNPVVFAEMFRLLRAMCVHCHRFRHDDMHTSLLNAKLSLLNKGKVIHALELDAKLAAIMEDDSDKVNAIEMLEQYVIEALATNNDEEVKNSMISTYRKQFVDEFMKRINKKCHHCGAFACSFRKEGTKIYKLPLSIKNQVIMRQKGLDGDILSKKGLLEEDEEDMEEEPEDLDEEEVVKGKTKTKPEFQTSFHVYEHFKRFWVNEQSVLDLMFSSSTFVKSSHEMMFVKYLVVPPNRFRPVSVMGDQKFDHPQNTYLSSILKLNLRLKEISSNKEEFTQMINIGNAIQEQVNGLFDSSKVTRNAKNAPPGIKQILEKKEGLFRKHMMGKRVNFAARSVISPDPNIDTNEIGIPMVFAKKLTYPEPVTAYNVNEMREAVIRGSNEYPGATQVIEEDGTLINLTNMSEEGRKAVANKLMLSGSTTNKKVCRHLKNGDVLLVNRQPTLHKPSIMAHVARVLPNEKTIRMHYANCNTYNADFDGDEMNLHFPQNEVARAESYTIANTDNQYLVPTDGNPLRGLIQDHVVTGVLMTMKDTFFTRQEYQQLLCGSLPRSMEGEIVTKPPAMIKPVPRWTGKQVISTLLLNLTRGRPQMNLKSKSKVPKRIWKGFEDEAEIIFMQGELVSGAIDKSQFGASGYGMVHSCYELYGADIAGKLLTSLGRLFTKYLQMIGFTCRMDDLIVKKEYDDHRK
ncbi:beta and beta-prime subunits of DNA dependent RNA-polymerase, partial [Rozella allomycis CSF55]